MAIFKSIKRRLTRDYLEINLPEKKVQQIVAKHKAHPWFVYIFKERKARWDVSKSCAWIAENCPRDALIYEVGCGCALNLIWLGQNGFVQLFGSDINENAISAGKELSNISGLEISLWCENGLEPKSPPDGISVLLTLICISHLENFSLEEFLKLYSARLQKNGCVIFDVVDTSFNKVPNNEYLTSDWGRPVEERKPSEYPTRLSFEQVALAAHNTGFSIHHTISEPQTIPKTVYVLRKI